MIAILSARSQLGAICKNDSTVRPSLCLQVPLPYLQPCACGCSIQGAVLQPAVIKTSVPFPLLGNFLPAFALTGKLLVLLWMYCIINDAPLFAILSPFSAVICTATLAPPPSLQHFCNLASCCFLPVLTPRSASPSTSPGQGTEGEKGDLKQLNPTSLPIFELEFSGLFRKCSSPALRRNWNFQQRSQNFLSNTYILKHPNCFARSGLQTLLASNNSSPVEQQCLIVQEIQTALLNPYNCQYFQFQIFFSLGPKSWL